MHMAEVYRVHVSLRAVLHTVSTDTFDTVGKVDPGNPQQLGAMWAYFSHNMEVVNFFLASCVLPSE
jgi:hypothetical protein